MDSISTEDLGKFIPHDANNEKKVITRDDFRKSLKSFYSDDNVRKYIFAEDVNASTYSDDSDSSLKDILFFKTPSLTKIRDLAKDKEDVKKRRKYQLDKHVRANIIYNEGIRYGAQAALRNTLNEFQKYINKESNSLDVNFAFQDYMLNHGTMIPPIINIQKDGKKITKDKFSEFNFKYIITAQAKFSDRTPNYRDYLTFQKYPVRDPSIFNIPFTDNELSHWMNGIYVGWKRGQIQAETEINNAEAKLKLDFLGMVRYHMLLKKGMVSAPVISKSTQNLSGDKHQIEVGVVNFIMDGEPVFQLDMANWKPLPLIDQEELKEFIKRKK